jgi:hypothetical protein
MPTSVDRVKVHLGITGTRPVDDEAITYAVNAANSLVVTLRPDLPAIDTANPDATVWPAEIDEAATIQASRYYGRRASVQGVASFQEAGVSLLAWVDPDVRLALGLGEFQPSAFA